MVQVNAFYQQYKRRFYISKFLVTTYANLFTINVIKYKTEVNKISLLNMFWVFFILFGQLPKLYFHNKQKIEKISHGFLLITKQKNTIPTIIKKLTNFFLLSAATEIITVKKKNKTKIDNISLEDNNYFNELANIPRLYVEPYTIIFTVQFNNTHMSIFEKAQILRIFQIPIVIGWNIKKNTFRKRTAKALFKQ